MPIYAYRCATCGHAKDVLRKISDPALTDCPACGATTFVKQVTAAGFQLKGSGWYVTDFRGDSKGAKPADDAAGGDTNKKTTDKAEPAKGDAAKPASADGASSESAKSTTTPASASTPATPATSSSSGSGPAPSGH